MANVTQKYDRGFMKRLSAADDQICVLLGKLYQCDGEEVPVDIDLNELKDLPTRSQQKTEVEAALKAHPMPKAATSQLKGTIEEILDLILTLQNPTSEGKDSDDGGASSAMSKVTMDEKSIDGEESRKDSKTLTMKYNRGFLAALTACDGEVCKICAALYDCEEDDIPVEIDVNELKDASSADQRKELEAEIAKFPVPSGSDISSSITLIMDALEVLKSKS